jgi:hypothetical protein
MDSLTQIGTWRRSRQKLFLEEIGNKAMLCGVITRQFRFGCDFAVLWIQLQPQVASRIYISIPIFDCLGYFFGWLNLAMGKRASWKQWACFSFMFYNPSLLDAILPRTNYFSRSIYSCKFFILIDPLLPFWCFLILAPRAKTVTFKDAN